MVNLAYIHKRRARRIIVAIALGCAATALVIGAAAMLGQKSSPFTVKLSNAGANLSLYTKGDDESSESKVYLMAPDVPAYCLYSERFLNAKQDVDDINTVSDISLDEDGITEIATRYFKYSFLVENKGSQPTDYDLKLTMSTPNYIGTNVLDLSSILRVRFYENKVYEDESLNKHDFVTYAKTSGTDKQIDENGRETWKERISDSNSDYAEEFLTSKIILKSHVSALGAGEKIRNTFVVWLEGFDPDCKGEIDDEQIPESSGLTLGVEISAYKAEDTTN